MSRRISLPCALSDLAFAAGTAAQWPECVLAYDPPDAHGTVAITFDAPLLPRADLECLAETVERAVALAIRQRAVVRRIVE